MKMIHFLLVFGLFSWGVAVSWGYLTKKTGDPVQRWCFSESIFSSKNHSKIHPQLCKSDWCRFSSNKGRLDFFPQWWVKPLVSRLTTQDTATFMNHSVKAEKKSRLTMLTFWCIWRGLTTLGYIENGEAAFSIPTLIVGHSALTIHI